MVSLSRSGITPAERLEEAYEYLRLCREPHWSRRQAVNLVSDLYSVDSFDLYEESLDIVFLEDL